MSIKWKFWEKDSGTPTSSSKNNIDKLQKPKDLPDRVGRHMVVKLELDPDWVWSLKCVFRKQADKPGWFDIKIFDPRELEATGSKLLSYSSLDAHPEIILYQGTYLDKSDQVTLTKREGDTRKHAA
ncbi:conserved hypothetical protein [Desulfamplus magnetovallimortis]|uniref:Uncharacterized protein n=1 Tax=Desulfamplus magnetovallimortis TaxID=1246637 RepID=A0A1W1HI11_9BACT|nr:hypothetical protein [Desulfamplus magnetovallimortis]SLM32055.1 conserved hypothetical protein [Desulfamplus magnetovallimortis]